MSNQNNDSYITVWVSFRVVHASKRYVELWSDCSYQQPGGLAVGTVRRRTDCPLHSNTIHIQHCHCTTLLPAHNPRATCSQAAQARDGGITCWQATEEPRKMQTPDALSRPLHIMYQTTLICILLSSQQNQNDEKRGILWRCECVFFSIQ